MAEFRVQVIVDPSDAERGSRRVRRELDGIENAADRLRGTITRALAFAGIGVSITELGRLADTFTNLQNRLRTVTSGQQELALVTGELFDISNRTRASFEATAELYARVGNAARDLGLSTQQTLNFTESLNQAVALSGASAAEAEAGIIQLSQGLASGALRGDELNSVLEQLPVVADVIAQSLDVTRGQLRELGADGRITADIVIDAFEEASETLATDFAQAVPTVGQALVVLRNNFLELIGGIDGSAGATQRLAELILVAAENVDTLARAGLAATIAFGTQFAVRGIGSAIAGIRALTVAIAANPIGAVAVAVTAAVSALIAFSDRIRVSSDGVANLQDLAQATFSAILRFIQPVIDTVTSFATTVIQAFGGAADGISFSIQDILIGAAIVIDGVIGVFAGGANAVVESFRNIPALIEIAWVAGFNTLIEIAEGAIQGVLAPLNLVREALGQEAILIGETFRLTTEMTVAGIGDNIASAFAEGFGTSTGVIDFVNSIFDDAELIAAERAVALAQANAERDLAQAAAGTPGTPGDIPGTSGASRDELETVLTQLRELQQLQDRLTAAYQAGLVAADEYALAQAQIRLESAELAFGITNVADQIRELNLQILDLAVTSGQGSFADGFLLELGRMNEGLTNFRSDAGTAFGQFFSDFSSGFANSIGQAIVGSQNLGDALRNVAQNAISQLIGSLVQLGIQYALNAAIGRSVAAASTAAATAQAAAIASAFAPAAALVSLATSGANAAGATAGIATATAAAQAASAIPGFQNGGLFEGIGGPRSDSNLARISDGEFIVNAAATRRNLDLLEQINSGADVSRARPVSVSAGSSAPVVNVQVINQAPGVEVAQERTSEGDIRLIVREEIQTELAQNGDSMVARNLNNPNSQTSRAVQRTTTARRRTGV